MVVERQKLQEKIGLGVVVIEREVRRRFVQMRDWPRNPSAARFGRDRVEARGCPADRAAHARHRLGPTCLTWWESYHRSRRVQARFPSSDPVPNNCHPIL